MMLPLKSTSLQNFKFRPSMVIVTRVESKKKVNPVENYIFYFNTLPTI